MEKQLILRKPTPDYDDEDKVFLTKQEIFEKLKKLFKKHIGAKNSITKLKLYKSVFGEPSNYDAYELWYNWGRIRQTMNWMRKATKYFVVCKQNERYSSIWEYFIVVDMAEADTYKRILKGTKLKIDFMLRRCDKAIKDKFWKDIVDGKE